MTLCRARDVAEHLFGTPVPELGREPYLETLIQGVFATRDQLINALSADPYRAEVQIVFDDSKLAVQPRRGKGCRQS